VSVTQPLTNDCFQRQPLGLLNHIAYLLLCFALFIFSGLFPTGAHQGVSGYCSKQIEVKEDPTVTSKNSSIMTHVEPHVNSVLST